MKPAHFGLMLRHFGAAMLDYRRYGVLENLERSQLATHEYTAVFPVRPGADHAALAKAIVDFKAHEESRRHSLLQRISALHTLRFIPLTAVDPRESAPAEPFAIVLSFLCDGNVVDVLEELFESARERLDTILRHCHDYPEDSTLEHWLGYAREHRVRSSYLFRDSRQLDPRGPHLHPSAAEIVRALELRRSFRKFVIEQQGRAPRERRAAFELAFVPQRELPGQQANDNAVRAPAPGSTLPLSAFERPLDHEGMWIRRLALFARTRGRRDARARARAGEAPVGLRAVHAKHHGLLRGRLRIRDDVPSRFQHGIFVPGREYEALVRPSNSANIQAPDWRPDARGLALKLIGVEGEQLLERPIPNGGSVPDGQSQDFTLVSHPTFFIRNARDFAILRSLVDAQPDGTTDKLELLASWAAFFGKRPREFAIFARTLLRWCSHPLLLEFHSLVPFLVGPNEAAKFSLRPTAATRAVLESEPLHLSFREFLRAPDDYLKAALQRSLDRLNGTPLIFEFALHVAREEPLPVEDPRRNWDALGAERVVAASLTIEAQDATSSVSMTSAENLVMTPWHGLAAHRPLGSLNRARLATYLASQMERWRVNGSAPTPQPVPGPGVRPIVAANGGNNQPAAYGGNGIE